jgi:hypothetical protein
MRRYVCRTVLFVFVLTASLAGAAELAELMDQPWYPKAPPLPKPTGEIVRAASVKEIYAALETVKPGGTVMIADGHYRFPKSVTVKTSKIVMRSESGDRTKVILDFEKSPHTKGVALRDCQDVTLADFTVQNVRCNGIKLNSNYNVDRITIYNIVLHNVWQRPIKGVMVPDVDGKPAYVEDCRVQYCLIYNDRPKRRGDDKGFDDKNPRSGYNYIAGMDVMRAKGWIISDNVFLNIHGGTGSARGAIFLWHNTRDTLIERNIIVDCDSGICLGNSSKRDGIRHCENVIVRNNFVTRCPEKNILAVHTRDCKILNNTVHDPKSRLKRVCRILFANDGLVVRNNIFSGPPILREKVEGTITVENNINKPVAGYFVDAAMGNLHLTKAAVEAIDKAEVLEAVTDDIDGAVRGEKPDIGADEL